MAQGARLGLGYVRPTRVPVADSDGDGSGPEHGFPGPRGSEWTTRFASRTMSIQDVERDTGPYKYTTQPTPSYLRVRSIPSIPRRNHVGM